MDITRWLQETEDPALPADPRQTAAQKAREEALLQDGARLPSHRKRQPNPPPPDSSLLEIGEPATSARRASPRTKGADAEQHGPHSHDGTSQSGSDPVSTSTESARAKYARKPRRKTRPELYEPQPAHGKKRKRSEGRKDKGKGAKRKSRRKAKDRPAGLVQSFHANNVPKDRLTLKPKENLGMFKRGRASSPHRSKGLPDLVFSEMRFLQKRNEPADPPVDDARTKRKKKETQRREEEISAYFGAKRPALAERSGNIPSKPDPSQTKVRYSPAFFKISRPSTSFQSIKPTIEVPEKPYLGFGSRGPEHIRSATRSISWSESMRHSAQVAEQESARNNDLRQKSRSRHQSYRTVTSVHSPLVSGLGAQASLHTLPESLNPLRHQSESINSPRDEPQPHTKPGPPGPETEQSVVSLPRLDHVGALRPRSSHKHRTHALQDRDQRPCQKSNMKDANDISSHSPRRTACSKSHTQAEREEGQRLHARDTDQIATSAPVPHDLVSSPPVCNARDCDAEGFQLKRSSSPLAKMLRDCNNACLDVPTEPERYDDGQDPIAPAVQFADHADVHYIERYPYSPADRRLPQGVAAAASDGPRLYQSQYSDEEMLYGLVGDEDAVEDDCLPEAAGGSRGCGGFYEDLEGDQGLLYQVEDEDGPFNVLPAGVNQCVVPDLGFEEQGGVRPDERRGLDEEDDEGMFDGFWRPHKLY
ncbi:hypothetical protein K490DRAFT_64988 [Saccharata proteae CBS 121410]|uniref:Uncharacterized protein n=1 Tax=Saccharata proteae CBS 121410 TaxID=1314787 RepID=A0A9P4HZY3_9PEZI|nr:hypothetical protein K490DRAFT_64988 [Saccharata proteae CBS 121410]